MLETASLLMAMFVGFGCGVMIGLNAGEQRNE